MTKAPRSPRKRKTLKFKTLHLSARHYIGVDGTKPKGAVSRTLWRRELAKAVKHQRREVTGRVGTLIESPFSGRE